MDNTNGAYYKDRNYKIYVSNVAYNCDHQDIKELFQKVGKVAFVEMLKDNNKPNGCAVVRFKDSDMVDKAIYELNRYEYKGRKIVVKDYRDAPPVKSAAPLDRHSRDRKRSRDSHDDFGFMDSAIKSEYTYGLSKKFLDSLGINGPLNNRVFVANLPYDATADDLKDLFAICGKVQDVELVLGDFGKSKGFGFIEFDHPIEAVQAISMLHDQPYHDRKLTVQYTQSEKRIKNSDSSRLPPGLSAIGMGLGVNGSPLTNVANTIKAGQQQNFLGAIPLNSANIPSLNLDMGWSSNSGHNFSNNLPAIQSDISPLMQSNLRENLTTGASLMHNPALSVRSNRSLDDSPAIGLGSSLRNTRNCIKVSNLPPDYTWKAICNLCQSFGEVSFAKIISQGIGIVHFENNTAANRAIDMLDQQEFEGRYLEAKFM